MNYVLKTWRYYKRNWWLYWVQGFTGNIVVKLLIHIELLYIIFHCIFKYVPYRNIEERFE
jgi:hypothetical protein